MILITGITGGIGNYLFHAFTKKQEPIIGTYHQNIPSGKGYENCHAVDITNNHAIEEFIQHHKKSLNNITLINCAGVTHSAFAHKAKIEDWNHVINVNLNGTYYMIRAVLPIMREQNYGRIINLSSVVAQTGVIGTSAYAASKAAINGMIKSIAHENAQKGITINNINLGYFNVGMIDTVPADMQEKIKSKIAYNQFGDPENILNTIQYIRETPYLTGSCIDLNGGLV
jgi:NAD(P)-dependent dehydrogenase (short-subunit alcohol dehydrogenase family)